MALCPVCNSNVEEGAAACPTCGFHFRGSTQEFKAIKMDTEGEQDLRVDTPDATLTVRYASGHQEGLVFTLTGEEMIVGRSPKSDIFLNDMTVSRRHAILQKVGTEWTIMDAQSYNGLWINHKEADHALLKDGDVIQIGCFILKYAK